MSTTPPEKQRIENALTNLFQSHVTFFSQTMWKLGLTGYKNYLLDKTEGECKKLDFQSNIFLPITRGYIESQWSGIYDSIFNVRVSGNNKEDHTKAQAAKSFIDWGFSRNNNRNEFFQVSKEALITGNGFGVIDFLNESNEVEYDKVISSNVDGKQVRSIEKQKKVYEQKEPRIQYVSCFDIFYDVNYASISEAPYVFRRKIMTLEDAVKRYQKFFPKNNVKTFVEGHAEKPFSPYDMNRVKYYSLDSDSDFKKMFMSWQQEESGNLEFFDFLSKNYLHIDFAKNKFVECIEYWEKDKFAVMFNGNFFAERTNPLPIKEVPFFAVLNNAIPGTCIGVGLGVSMDDIQKVSNALINFSIDNIKMNITPMMQRIRGVDMFGTGSQYIEWEPFKIIEVDSPDGLQKLQMGLGDFSGVNLIQFLMQIGEISEGTNSYGMGYQNKVERSATGVSALVTAFKQRLLALVDSMNQALQRISKFWCIYAAIHFDKTFTVKILEDEAEKFVEIDVDSLLGDFDIIFDAQSLKTATREVRREQAIQLLTLASTVGINPITGVPFVDVSKLWTMVIDSFELQGSEFILSPKDVIKTQNAVQIYQQKQQQKNFGAQGANGFPPTAPGGAGAGLPAPGEIVDT